MPEKHHLYNALQAKPSPGIQTYRDALFPARRTPHKAPGSSMSQSRSWSCAKQTLRASIAILNAVTSNYLTPIVVSSFSLVTNSIDNCDKKTVWNTLFVAMVMI